MTAQEQLKQFDLSTIPPLDVAVLGALELFSNESLPILSREGKRRLVLGSGNAAQVATLLFDHTATEFANENNFIEKLTYATDVDEVVVISASGGKHAVAMVQAAQEQGYETHLITNNVAAPAAALLPAEQVLLFPKNREPYTYNTSTYLGPILAVSKESPQQIHDFITTVVSRRLLRNLADYHAFTFIVPDQYAPLCNMIVTKFDELFGPMLVGRAFTESEIMHAKTVVNSGEELFIALNVDNRHYGLEKNRFNLTLDTNGVAAMMATSYYLIGQIQRAHPPYFAMNIAAYCKTASEIFNQTIQPIVE